MRNRRRSPELSPALNGERLPADAAHAQLGREENLPSACTHRQEEEIILKNLFGEVSINF